jgi:DNA polymerase-3 subunit alpha/error-prone DNA polymerase
MAGVLSNQGGYYRACAYISECRRMRLKVEGPDINISRWRYYGNKDRVIVGFMAIKGLSHSGAETIILEREERGEFSSLSNFCMRVKISRDDIISMVSSGAFDSIAKGESRAIQARILLSRNRENVKQKQDELFIGEEIDNKFIKGQDKAIISPSKKVSKNNDELWEEYRTLGFLRNLHLFALWKDKVLSTKRIKASWLPKYIGSTVKLIGLPITEKEVWTKEGLAMSFLSFEDETAMYETVIFPQVYDKYHSLLFDFRPLIVYGLVVNDNGALTVEVSSIEVL